MTVPPGFEILQRSSPLLDLLGPVYCRSCDAGLILAMRCETKHCNARGFVHGGMLCTLADIALGYNVALAAKTSGLVTTNLTIDYAGSARSGDWIEIAVDVQKVGATLAFANGYFKVDDKRIARASAIFCNSKGSLASVKQSA